MMVNLMMVFHLEVTKVVHFNIVIRSVIRYFARKFYIVIKPLIQNFYILKYGLQIKILPR